MENKNTHQEVERKLKNWTRNQGFLRAKHPVRRCGYCEKRSDYTKASWEVLSSPPEKMIMIVRKSYLLW